MKDGSIGARKEAKNAAKMRPGWMPQRKPLISPMKKRHQDGHQKGGP